MTGDAIERLGIAGSGTIACGLAATAAAAGCEVELWARSPASAERALAAVRRHCERLGAPDGAARLRVHTELGELAGATLLVEAIAEDHEAKVALLRRLTLLSASDVPLATTTSSLSIGRLGVACGAPERLFGLHVFNPVPRMELIELAFAPATSSSVRRRATALCEALGKRAVEVPDIPGFVVNRLLFPYLFQAVELLEQTGLTPDDVDACMTLGAAHPMGPCALLDFVGLDVAVAIGETLDVAVPRRLRALVAEGALGRKSGRGLREWR